MNITKKQYQNIGETYCPTFHFDMKDNSPCSIEWMCNNSSLYDDKNTLIKHKPTLNDIEYEYNNPKYHLYLRDYDGQGFKNFPIYCIITDMDTHFYIQYFLLYTYNPGVELFGSCIPTHYLMGKHQGDLEHVSLLIEKTTSTIEKVRYSAHSSKQGVWVENEHLPFDENGRLQVYVAKGSHAMYPFNKTVPRICGVANDIIKSNIKCNENTNEIVVLNNKKNRWLFTKMYLTPDQMTAPGYRDWWRKMETNYNATWYSRLFGCMSW